MNQSKLALLFPVTRVYCSAPLLASITDGAVFAPWKRRWRCVRSAGTPCMQGAGVGSRPWDVNSVAVTLVNFSQCPTIDRMVPALARVNMDAGIWDESICE